MPEAVICIDYDREILIQIEDADAQIIYSESQAGDARALLSELERFLRKPRRSAGSIFVVVDNGRGTELQQVPCPSRRLSLRTHYNDDLAGLHPQILRSLRQKGRSGLYLFHGRPGTGKSSYIRSLLPLLNKRCIFLSPRLAGNLDSPGLSGILLRNPETVLIIEDAEELLMSRNQLPNAAISTLLNVTDGVLGASLGIQVICTFNTALTQIDPALLRKGRLAARYEFGPLSLQRTNALLQLEKAERVSERPMTLAEIFNRESAGEEHVLAPAPIGFRLAGM